MQPPVPADTNPVDTAAFVDRLRCPAVSSTLPFPSCQQLPSLIPSSPLNHELSRRPRCRESRRTHRTESFGAATECLCGGFAATPGTTDYIADHAIQQIRPAAPLVTVAASKAALPELSRDGFQARPLYSVTAHARQAAANVDDEKVEAGHVAAVRRKYTKDNVKKLEPVVTMPCRAGTDITVETQRLIRSIENARREILA